MPCAVVAPASTSAIARDFRRPCADLSVIPARFAAALTRFDSPLIERLCPRPVQRYVICAGACDSAAWTWAWSIWDANGGRAQRQGRYPLAQGPRCCRGTVPETCRPRHCTQGSAFPPDRRPRSDWNGLQTARVSSGQDRLKNAGNKKAQATRSLGIIHRLCLLACMAFGRSSLQPVCTYGRRPCLAASALAGSAGPGHHPDFARPPGSHRAPRPACSRAAQSS